LPGRLAIWTINSYKYLAEKFGYIGELTWVRKLYIGL
jgi:hypothetical protein